MTNQARTRVLRALEGAAELVERGWHQGFEAADVNDRSVHPMSDAAVKWCLVGAIRRASEAQYVGSCEDDSTHPGSVASAAERVVCCVVGRPPHRWNDAPERTKPEVITAIRTAAEGVRNAILLATALPIGKET